MTMIIPQGIQRSASGQNCPDGACEEIINARFKNGSWRVIAPKKVIAGGVDYEQVYVHKYGEFENYIGVKDGRVAWFDPQTKAEKQEICTISGEVVFSCLNNVLLIRGRENLYHTIFIDGKRYSIVTNQFPEVPDLAWKVNLAVEKNMGTIIIKHDVDTLERIKDTLNGYYNRLKNKCYEEGDFTGYMFIRLSFLLFDGTETMISSPFLVEVGENKTELKQTKSVEGEVHYSIYGLSSGNLSLTLSMPPEIRSDFVDIISGVCIYSSPVIDYLDVLNGKLTDTFGTRITDYKRDVSKVFDEQAYYRIKTIPMDEFLVEPDLSFRDMLVKRLDIKYEDIKNITTLEDIPASSSRLVRYGEMFMYNNRLHLFNIRSKLNPFPLKNHYLKPFTGDTEWQDECLVLFEIRHSNKTKYVTGTKRDRLFGYDSKTNSSLVNVPKLITFPDSRAVRAVYLAYHQSGGYYIEMGSVKLKASKKYDFAYAFCESGEIRVDINDCKVSEIDLAANSDTFDGSNEIIVSDATNPYYFPPQHSYMTSGEIVAMAVNTEQISASQIGQFPVYVFTTEGIFALQVGDGNVLYSNMIPVSAEIAVNKNVVQTKHGIVFATADGLKLIAGSEVVNLSEPVSGAIDYDIRRCEAFRNATGDPRLHTALKLLSACDFEEYISTAVMGYDTTRDELIVSNPPLGYSYVFGFQSKMWHKITDVFHGFSRGIAYVRKELSDVLNLAEEKDEGNIFHIQTRPMKMGSAAFKRFTRMLARGEFLPQPERYFSLYVFGSQDLREWKFLSGKQVNVDTVHIVVQGIPCSYRYVVFVMGGDVRAGHMLSHFEMEGEAVLDQKIR